MHKKSPGLGFVKIFFFCSLIGPFPLSPPKCPTTICVLCVLSPLVVLHPLISKQCPTLISVPAYFWADERGTLWQKSAQKKSAQPERITRIKCDQN